jgi:hypothetical protein
MTEAVPATMLETTMSYKPHFNANKIMSAPAPALSGQEAKSVIGGSGL